MMEDVSNEYCEKIAVSDSLQEKLDDCFQVIDGKYVYVCDEGFDDANLII